LTTRSGVSATPAPVYPSSRPPEYPHAPPPSPPISVANMSIQWCDGVCTCTRRRGGGCTSVQHIHTIPSNIRSTKSVRMRNGESSFAPGCIASTSSSQPALFMKPTLKDCELSQSLTSSRNCVAGTASVPIAPEGSSSTSTPSAVGKIRKYFTARLNSMKPAAIIAPVTAISVHLGM